MRNLSLSPVVKLGRTLEPISDPVPPELREARRRLGFDYGKFDYGIVDGSMVLYDVNRTPCGAENSYYHFVTDGLWEGIHAFLDGKSRSLSTE